LRVGDGTVRKSVGEFLQALRCNFSSFLTRFRATVSAVSCLVVPAFICIDVLYSCASKLNDDDDDDDIAAFVLQHTTFPTPPLVSSNFPMFPGQQVDGLSATKSEGVGLIVCVISYQGFQPI